MRPRSAGGGRFDLLSRESFLLANNLLLTVLAGLILLGTLAPLIYDALAWGKISVGFPWFNRMFVMLTPFLALFMGIGPLARWKHNEGADLVRTLRWALALSVAIGLLTLLPGVADGRLLVGLGMGLAVWVVTTQLIRACASVCAASAV